MCTLPDSAQSCSGLWRFVRHYIHMSGAAARGSSSIEPVPLTPPRSDSASAITTARTLAQEKARLSLEAEKQAEHNSRLLEAALASAQEFESAAARNAAELLAERQRTADAQKAVEIGRAHV